LTAFGAEAGQSTTLEVAHRQEKLAPEPGVEFMATIFGAGVWSVCQGPKGYSESRNIISELVNVTEGRCGEAYKDV